MARPSLTFAAFVAAPVAMLAAACALDFATPAQPSGEFVLVGQGCGPHHEIMVAREEDHFPVGGCEAIDVHWLEDAQASTGPAWREESNGPPNHD